MTAHWAFQYIGQPWVAHSNDCWAFFRRVQADQFNCTIPEIHVDADDIRACIRAFDGHDERGAWARFDTPQEGDAVLMSQGSHPTHVGLWLDVNGGGVLHCIKGSGVIFTRVGALPMLGYNMLGFYRKKAD